MKEQKIFGITIGGKSKGKKGKAEAGPTITPEQKAAFVYTPETPGVNVVPHTVLDKYEVKSVLRNVGFAAVGVVALLALLFGGSQYLLMNQRTQLAQLEAEQSLLTQESQALQPYAAYLDAVNAKREELSAVTAYDVSMGSLYTQLNAAANAATVGLTSVSVTQYDPGVVGTECINPDPFGTDPASQNVIGCITLAGEADNREQVDSFLANLLATDGNYTSVFISSFTNNPEASEGARVSAFNATVAFTNNLYSSRYNNLTLTVEDLLAGAGPGETGAEGTPEVTYLDQISQVLPDLSEEERNQFAGLQSQACGPGADLNLLTEVASIVSARGGGTSLSETADQITEIINSSCEAVAEVEDL